MAQRLSNAELELRDAFAAGRKQGFLDHLEFAAQEEGAEIAKTVMADKELSRFFLLFDTLVFKGVSVEQAAKTTGLLFGGQLNLKVEERSAG